MVTKNISKLPKSLVEVTITVPWVDMEAKWNEVLTKMAAELELPGFRKGQVLPQMAEQSLGVKLQDEVFKVVFPQFLVEALQGSNIVPIDYPKYQLVSFTKDQSLVFKALVTERPQVAVGEYKQILAGKNIQRPATKVVTPEDIEKVLADLFKRWKAKQPLQPGKSTAPATPTTTGSLDFGQSNGQVAATPVAALLDIPNDDFARAVGALSIADLKTKIKADLESESKFYNEMDYEEAILQEVEKITTVEVPDVLIEDELMRMMVTLQRRVSEMGLLVEDYLKSQNETVEGLKAKWKPQAEKNVRMELGLAEIARLENIQISDTELQAEIDKVQDARLKAQLEGAEPRLHLKHNLRQMKTLDFLKGMLSGKAAA